MDRYVFSMMSTDSLTRLARDIFKQHISLNCNLKDVKLLECDSDFLWFAVGRISIKVHQDVAGNLNKYVGYMGENW